MQQREEFETVMYRQRLAHKSWMSAATAEGLTPSAAVEELVWELLITYGEAVQDFEAAREDIYKTAYELATLALADTAIEQIMQVYRDHLLDAMMDACEKDSREEYRTLVSFANVVSSAFCEAHSDLLKKTIRHNRAESLSGEFKLAKQIQSHLLPKVIPNIPGFDFAGKLVPAEELGGDYWSIKHYQDDGVVTMKLADITGHGVAAATLVAAVKFISGSYYRACKSAAEVIWQTNRVLTKETPYDVLVTMAYGWLRPATYELTVVNAGHEPVFVCREDTCEDIPPTGPVLGVSEDVEYTERTYLLAKNHVVFFGSDGITEAGIGEPFGMERLKKLVTSHAHLTASQIADKVVDTVKAYANPPHDDISLLVVKVTGDGPESK